MQRSSTTDCFHTCHVIVTAVRLDLPLLSLSWKTFAMFSCSLTWITYHISVCRYTRKTDSEPWPLEFLVDHESRRCPNVLTRRGCINRIHSRFCQPAIYPFFPVRNSILVQNKLDSRCLAGLQEHLGKRLQCTWWMCECGSGRKGCVQLHDLRASEGSDVGEFEWCGDAEVSTRTGWLGESKVGIFEACVG